MKKNQIRKFLPMYYHQEVCQAVPPCKKKCRNVFVGLKKNANFACGESLEK